MLDGIEFSEFDKLITKLNPPFFLISIHVPMLHRKFELIPIKIGFLKLLNNLTKDHGLRVFCQKWLEENSSFLLQDLLITLS